VILLQEVLVARPNDGTALLNMGVAKEKLGEMSEARRYYESATKSDSPVGNAWLGVGAFQERDGNWEGALASYRSGSKIDPKNMDLRVAIIGILRSLGRVDEAITEAKEALKVNANSLPVYNNLGLAYLDRGETDLAVFVFQKAMQGVPGAENNAYIRANLGWIFYQRGEKGPALYHLQEAVKLDGQLVPALVYLSAVYLDDRNYGDALPLLEAAAKKDAENYGVQLNLGICYRGVGRYPDAKAAYEKALSLRPGSSEPWFNLGILYGDYIKLQDATVTDRTLQAYDDAITSYRTYLGSGGKQQELANTYITTLEKEKKKAEKKRQKEQGG
jgi:tetratricopeptide (TPR) repeat protein